MSSNANARQSMIEQQLMPRGVVDPLTLQGMSTVPRHSFVPEELIRYAYEDGPLAIGYSQTISQPYIVAEMTQAAELNHDSVVLEIGTGSGYGAAVLSRICKEVYTVERIPELVERARACLAKLDYQNVYVKRDDGTLGWAGKGPFDAILVTAGAPDIPEALMVQLKVGGRLIIPVGDHYSQELVRMRKIDEQTANREPLGAVRFVPLIGEQGWSSENS